MRNNMRNNLRTLRFLAVICIFICFFVVFMPSIQVKAVSAEDVNTRFFDLCGEAGTEAGQFNDYGPSQMAVDSEGNLYAVDPYNYRVQKFDANGHFILQWGEQGAGNEQFVYPNGIAIDSSDNVYVTDWSGHCVKKFTKNGVFLQKYGGVQGSGDGQFNGPRAITIDNAGNFYVAENGGSRIQKFNSSFVYITKWGSNGSEVGQFSFLSGIAVDAAGYVYVSEEFNKRVQRFNSDGSNPSVFVTDSFNSILDVYTDVNGYIYVGVGSTLSKYNSDGTLYHKYFNSISGIRGITMDSTGNIYVSSSEERKVKKSRILNDNSYLSGLSISGYGLNPVFNKDELEYSLDVEQSVESIIITPVVEYPSSSVRVNGSLCVTGSQASVSLLPGNNPIVIEVTAESGVKKQYTLTVKRAINEDMYYARVIEDGCVYGTTYEDINYVGWYLGFAEKTAIKFNLSDFEGSILSAKLYVNVNYVDATSGAPFFNLYGSSDDNWTEGVSFPKSDILMTTIIENDTDVPSVGQWKCFDVLGIKTFLENQIVDDPSRIVTFVLTGPTLDDPLSNKSSEVGLYGDESEVSKWPYIEIVKYIPDTIKPGVVSINRFNPTHELTNTSPIVYRVTFSEDVSGVDVSDFSLNSAGTVTGTITSVSTVSGTEVDVVVDTISGDGTLRLDLKASGTGIIDLANNGIDAGFTGGQMYSIDSTPPETTINTGPPTSSNSASATFNISSNESGITFESSLDGGGFGECTVPVNYIGLSDGGHIFVIRAIDAAGNADLSPATYSWLIDTTPPLTTIGDRPPLVTNSTSAAFTFTSNDSEAAYEFSIDGSAFALCTDSSVIITGMTETNHTLAVRAIDTFGNIDPTPATYSWTIDTTKPNVPFITGISEDTGVNGDFITSDKTLLISGTAEANSIVTLLVNGDIYATSSVNGSGIWSVNYTETATGETINMLSAFCTDVAGNDSSQSGDYTLFVDPVAPEKPIILGISDDTGISSTDGITNATNILISGTAEPDSIVTVLRDGMPLGTSTVNSSGIWSYSTGVLLSNSTYNFSATGTDCAGNISPSSTVFPVTVDTLAPSAPIVSTISDDSGFSSFDGITNDNTLVISGTAELNCSVEVFIDGSLVGTVYADGSGIWSLDYTHVTLPIGNHSITAKVSDAAGNISALAAGLTIEIDIEVPAAPTELDMADGSDKGISGTDNITNDNKPVFTGIAEEGVAVKLYDGSIEIGSTTAMGGNWSITASELSNGDHIITVKATDSAGNISNASEALAIKVDTLSPILMGVSRLDNTHITVTLSENCFDLSKVNNGGFNVYDSVSPATTYSVSSISQGEDASHVVLTVADMGRSARTGVTVKYTEFGNGTIQDTASNSLLTDNTGVILTAWDSSGPTISSTVLASNNTYIDITFNEGIYGAMDGLTSLTVDKLFISFTKNTGSASNVQISSIKKSDSTSENLATELTGRETVVRVFLVVSGTPNGAETIEISPIDSTSIFDQAGNASLGTLTTGVKTLANQVVPLPPTSSPTPQETSTTIAIIVNGQEQQLATSATTQKDSMTITTITLDDAKIGEKLAQEGQNSTVVIPVNSGADVVVGELNGQTVKNMEIKETVLEIRTENVTYTLPASQINIDYVSTQIGEQIELKNIKVSVTIAAPSSDTVRIVEDTANKNSYQVVVKPIEFSISCTSGDKTVEVSKFNGYVERTVAIPEGIDPSKITTGIVLNSDGTFSHVPTTIVIIDGKYYAKINSLTNSTYSVIWNPVTFKDLEGHWGKQAVNDMASRLVVEGVDKDTFAPNTEIERGEFVAIVIKSLGLMRTAVGKDIFSDVSTSYEYYDAISIAHEYGLVAGYGNGTFKPKQSISRQEAMIIMVKAMAMAKMDTKVTKDEIHIILSGFSDSSELTGYAREAAAACIKNGIFSGYNGRITAKVIITRAQTALIVRQMLLKAGLI